MTLGAAPVELGAVLLDVVLGAAANELLELLLRELAELDALAAGAEAHALGDLAVELELAIRRGEFGGDVAPRAHHAAADVEAHRAHRDRALRAIGEDHASDRDAVAVVHVGRDHDQAHAGKRVALTIWR